MDQIRVRGAREHNLKNLSLDIPRDALVVLRLGLGEIIARLRHALRRRERRYVESLSTYARQFLDQMEKPDVDQIEGSPAISIEQRTAESNPRSTVATVTEIYYYLRLLYSRVGIQHCVSCGRPIRSHTRRTDRSRWGRESRRGHCLRSGRSRRGEMGRGRVPPAPRGPRISYAPRRVPEVRVTGSPIY